MFVVNVLMALPALGLGIISGYLLLLVVGSFFMRKKADYNAQPLRFAILTPAHNEELQIGNTVSRIYASDYPRDRFHSFVIADNCSDATAQNARDAGATVFERHDLTLRGKGQALDWCLKTNRDVLSQYDAIALVDADTSMHPRFLAELSASLSHPDVRVVQAWNGVSNPEANWRTALTWAGFALINGLRPAGRSFWGGTADIKGNGMAFRSEVLLGYGWPAHSIVEDIEFSVRLLLDDIRVYCNHDAIVISEMPTTQQQAEPQRKRWESGRVQTLRNFAPPLLRALVRRPRWRYLDMLLELCVPPLSLFVFAQVAMLGVALVSGLFLGWHWVIVFGTYFAITILYVVAGLYQRNAPREVWVGLLAVPMFLLWKIPFYARLLFGKKQQTWERTQRLAEVEREKAEEVKD
ncbi:MAG TPA: glycosyltransferase family 2 protein [Candidatus Hydrogenedentes bacterium]|nr:glycosyltransferase family 2 protein [Candidatus Hydrogenedentota bacterium]HRK34296.1 glycosyltransferase family 2 protein [Candidatus Hydrogenedentota bacterium]